MVGEMALLATCSSDDLDHLAIRPGIGSTGAPVVDRPQLFPRLFRACVLVLHLVAEAG